MIIRLTGCRYFTMSKKGQTNVTDDAYATSQVVKRFGKCQAFINFCLDLADIVPQFRFKATVGQFDFMSVFDEDTLSKVVKLNQTEAEDGSSHTYERNNITIVCKSHHCESKEYGVSFEFQGKEYLESEVKVKFAQLEKECLESLLTSE